MLFSDLFFLFFFMPLCCILYYIAKDIKQKNSVLIIFSLFFYVFGEPIKVLFLLLSVGINYIVGLLIADDKARGKSGKGFLIIGLLFDIGMLGVFKYTDFLIDNINGIFGTSIAHSGIVMPLGISFFTFQILSYIIDVYWDKVPVQKKFHKLLLYITMFPQLVAGPIVRYETVAAEIDNRTVTLDDLCDGMTRFVTGLAKKVLIANTLNLAVNEFFGTSKDALLGASNTVVGCWMGAICYALLIYFDFSGYSDMAIGMGRMFGFHFDENFDHPFASKSISEFWQRWHISLGSFFRDYLLYLPIFGKRRQYMSIFLVWFTTGLWHGASWNFVIWGLYFGIFVFTESKIGKKKLKKVPAVAMHIYTALVLIIGFGIFYFTDMQSLGLFLKGLVGASGQPFISDATTTTLTKYLYVILFALITSMPVLPAIKNRIKKCNSNVKGIAQLASCLASVVMLVMVYAVLVDSFATNNVFIYFRF